jgi:hypothetical protein
MSDRNDECAHHCGCGTHTHDQPSNPNRRSAVRKSASFLLSGLAILGLGSLAARPAQASYGCCWKCGCQGFESTPGDQERCSNCGHMYSDHGRNCDRDRPGQAVK